jgi:hypothetical protein
MYFEMKPEPEDLETEQKKMVLRKEVEKHELGDIKWATDLL